MSQGWICLHRQMLEWEWYSDVNTTRLFIHCLLKANHKEKKWQGKVIPRGSFITGRSVLAEETGLTEQQIRTAINKLKSTNNITIKATNKFSLVTLVNYDMYQDRPSESTSESTGNSHNEQPTSNQQSTTTNNDNNDNNGNNKRAKPVLFSQAVDLFNEVCVTLPEVLEKTDKRRRLFGSRWKESVDRQNLDWWRQYFEYINQSPFLMGKTEANFKCNFDWIINGNNMAKIIEGNYNQ